ncbi:phosphonate ABC transporter, permease protein PhnE [Caldalkalibacillus salinus]|uniref:phosphonate ABC transporter, permease protein PhnE n=1 Tax=Caldalkalibacillus salinus TaxID=2803787 RepID=UPI0019235D5F|nr:phosphonate ABC transporter, permease protein PhnE [Caldalkalibacillus salinus]
MWFNRKNILLSITIIGVLIWSAIGTDFSLDKLRNFAEHYQEIIDLWFPPNFERVDRAFNAILLTLQVAFFGSFVALLIVLPISFFAAKNTSPNATIYHLVRNSLSVLRSVPDIVIGIILVMAIGLGPFPAVMAILLHNIGVLGKLISELIEAADKGPQEAVASLGLGRMMIAMYGILPQIIPNILSHYFYRFEVAIRSSIILGFIGGGGIGQLLMNAQRVYAYGDVMLYVLFIMALVILVDMMSSYVRSRVI